MMVFFNNIFTYVASSFANWQKKAFQFKQTWQPFYCCRTSTWWAWYHVKRLYRHRKWLLSKIVVQRDGTWLPSLLDTYIRVIIILKNQHSLIPSNDTKYRLPFEVAVYLIKPGLSKVKSCNVPATSTNPGQHNLLVLG